MGSHVINLIDLIIMLEVLLILTQASNYDTLKETKNKDLTLPFMLASMSLHDRLLFNYPVTDDGDQMTQCDQARWFIQQ